MNSEIELKFYAPDGCVGELQQILEKFSVLQHEERHLRSVYFDTAERHLKKWRMGLRIRAGDEQNVQTIKTAGRNIGGLHERPEYNQVIEGNHPQLARFEQLSWPDDIELDALEQQLIPIFVTDFSRTTWLVDLDNETLIEVALDCGFLQSGEKQEPIQEIELELVKGDIAQLFYLAGRLTELSGLQLSSSSKAKRGYALADQTPHEQPSLLHFVPLSADMSIPEAFIQSLEYAMHHWQYHQQLYIQSHDLKALIQLKQASMLMHQVFNIYQDVVDFNCPWHAELLWWLRQLSWLEEALSIEKLLDQHGAFIRKLNNRRTLSRQLEDRLKQLPDADDVLKLLSSPRYNRLMVDIVSWLYQGERVSSVQQIELLDFAEQALELSWQELRNSDFGSESISFEQYTRMSGRLRRNLMVGNCLGDLFLAEERDDFRLLWLDILGGVDDLQLLEPIAELIEESDDDDEDIRQVCKWLHRKRESITDAIEFTRIEALARTDYWHRE
ncbi:MAG: hypothetical protein CENE_02140 [Candidatus Celerinatantimonas neptuna]|nr:MAG: hypothetical protein CENE_02140 [Candidatus Celerinatantimonas neptuna]